MLDVVRRTGGAIADVSDEEIVDAMRLLASTEGIFGETAGGVTLAVLRKLLAAGQLDRGGDRDHQLGRRAEDAGRRSRAVDDVPADQADPRGLAIRN